MNTTRTLDDAVPFADGDVVAYVAKYLLPETIHTPLSAKHPPVRLIPAEKLDVAFPTSVIEPVPTLRLPSTATLPANVEVAPVPVTAKLVVVAAVVVALTPVKFWSVVDDVTRRLPSSAIVALRIAAKRLVVVACTVVALTPVKFWSVVDEFTNKVLVTISVNVPAVERKMEAKRFVDVACDVVAFRPVKSWSVEEPVARKLAATRFVVVALVAVAFAVVSDVIVEDACEIIPDEKMLSPVNV